jgi:hypothetical protein
VASVPDESSGLAEVHVKISANGKPKSISTFGFRSVISLRNQNRQGNKCGADASVESGLLAVPINQSAITLKTPVINRAAKNRTAVIALL